MPAGVKESAFEIDATGSFKRTIWYPLPDEVAFKVLQATEDGGYASDLLLTEAATLDSRDAGLASEIVFGCLRRQGQLDWLIASVARRDADRMDTAVRIALRMGLYQLRHLDRVPAHASLNESVELVKMARKTSAAGLVNAVLRRAPEGGFEWPDRSVALSMPQWLLARWDEQFGPGDARADRRSVSSPPETYVRNPAENRRIVLEPTDVPGAFRVVSGDPKGLAHSGYRFAIGRAIARSSRRTNVSRSLCRSREQDGAGARIGRSRHRLRCPSPPVADGNRLLASRARRHGRPAISGTVRPRAGRRALLGHRHSRPEPEIRWSSNLAISKSCTRSRSGS